MSYARYKNKFTNCGYISVHYLSLEEACNGFKTVLTGQGLDVAQGITGELYIRRYNILLASLRSQGGWIVFPDMTADIKAGIMDMKSMAQWYRTKNLRDQAENCERHAVLLPAELAWEQERAKKYLG